LSSHDSHVAVEEKKGSCCFVEMKNGLSFSQIVAPFMSTSVGCWYFGNKLLPHFDAMSLVSQTPWKASFIHLGGEKGCRSIGKVSYQEYNVMTPAKAQT